MPSYLKTLWFVISHLNPPTWAVIVLAAMLWGCWVALGGLVLTIASLVVSIMVVASIALEYHQMSIPDWKILGMKWR